MTLKSMPLPSMATTLSKARRPYFPSLVVPNTLAQHALPELLNQTRQTHSQKLSPSRNTRNTNSIMKSKMDNFRALIVGAGVGGPVLAYWLAKAGAQVTMIERGSALRSAGQGLDFDGPSKEIIRRMGLLDDMKAKRTCETGFAFVDDQGEKIATTGGLTSEIEVMRGDMVRILCNAAEKFENVNILYGRAVTAIVQDPEKVTVTFENGENAEYDAVIGADGLHSKTRELVFGKKTSADAVKARPSYCAVWSVPFEDGDSPHARVQHAPGGRVLFLRPLDEHRSSAYLLVFGQDNGLERAMYQGPQAQKEAMRKVYSDVSGLAPRSLREMMTADDFWAGQLAQVKLSKWSKGRCAVIGDAAYAPSPLAGAGTHLAIVGAYHLAGELSNNPQNPAAAMEAYETRIRSYVDQEQQIPLGGYAQNLLQPQTRLGISLVRFGFKLFARSGIAERLGSDPGSDQVEFPSCLFPSYCKMDPGTA